MSERLHFDLPDLFRAILESKTLPDDGIEPVSVDVLHGDTPIGKAILSLHMTDEKGVTLKLRF